MTRAAALAGALALALAAPGSGCGFAVRHPAATAGIVGGTMALGTCELATDEHGSCFLAAGGVAAFLGLVALGALWLGSTGEDSVLQPPPDPVPSPRPRPQEKPPAPPAAPEAAP